MADYNAEDNADIVWRNRDTVENYVCLMNGSAVMPKATCPP